MNLFKFTCTAILATSLFFSCSVGPETGMEKPNVILFLIDDFGYADISYEGNTQIKTPSIDQIAENGAHFTNFYQSGAACAPTRASLLTGRYHFETGVWGVHAGRDFIHRDETTIADVIRRAGYTTGAFGKWHSGKTWPYFSWNRGFDVGVHSKLYQYFDTQMIYNNKLINVDGPITDIIGEQMVRFIQGNRSTLSYEDSAGWHLRKDKDGIKIYTRDLENKGILEYRAITTIDTNLEQLIRIIHDVENYPAWTANCASAEIHKVINDSTRIEYMTTPVPWPLSDRDVVMEFVVTKHTDNYFEAYLTSVPDAVPENDKYVRIKDSEGFWIFNKIDINKVEIIHQFYGDPEGNIPKWIINMFIVSGPYKTLLNLKDLCNSP